MQRGEFYRVRRPVNDVRKSRIFLVISRERFLATNYSTVICVPVYTTAEGMSTEVPVGTAEGMSHPSVLRCDEVTSLPRRRLTDFVGTASEGTLRAVNRALAIALDIQPEDIEDL